MFHRLSPLIYSLGLIMATGLLPAATYADNSGWSRESPASRSGQDRIRGIEAGHAASIILMASVAEIITVTASLAAPSINNVSIATTSRSVTATIKSIIGITTGPRVAFAAIAHLVTAILIHAESIITMTKTAG